MVNWKRPSTPVGDTALGLGCQMDLIEARRPKISLGTWDHFLGDAHPTLLLGTT